MMSVFFYFQPTLNRLFSNCIKLILDKFFLKYTQPTFKKPSLIRVKVQVYISVYLLTVLVEECILGMMYWYGLQVLGQDVTEF